MIGFMKNRQTMEPIWGQNGANLGPIWSQYRVHLALNVPQLAPFRFHFSLGYPLYIYFSMVILNFID